MPDDTKRESVQKRQSQEEREMINTQGYWVVVVGSFSKTRQNDTFSVNVTTKQKDLTLYTRVMGGEVFVKQSFWIGGII